MNAQDYLNGQYYLNAQNYLNTQNVLAIIAIISSVVMSIFVMRQSSKIAKEKLRPKFEVCNLTIDLLRTVVFKGEDVITNNEQVMKFSNMEKKHRDELANPERFMSNYVFKYENEEHWMINLIPKDTDVDEASSSIIVALRTLVAELKFDENTVQELEVIYGYTKLGEKSIIPNTTVINVPRILENSESKEGKVTIIISYVCVDEKILPNPKDFPGEKYKVKCNGIKANNRKSNAIKQLLKNKHPYLDTVSDTEPAKVSSFTDEIKPLDMLISESAVYVVRAITKKALEKEKLPCPCEYHHACEGGKIDLQTCNIAFEWLQFLETGYVFRLWTVHNNDYDYSLILTTKDIGGCSISPVSNDKHFFFKIAGSGSIVQFNPTNKFWKRILEKIRFNYDKFVGLYFRWLS